MTYGLADVVQQRRLIESSEASDAYKRVSSAKLDALLGLCETAECRRVQLLAYFGEASAPCGNCDTCLQPPETWDGTVPAQKLLSTVVRLEREHGQHFGAGHVIDILRGKETPRVTQLGHTALSTFGIGDDLSDGEWRGVVRQLLAQGLLSVDARGYSTLELTAGSAEILSGAREVPMRREAPRPARSRRSAGSTGGGRGSRVVEGLDADAAELFERLRAWRAATAKDAGVPAYVVFHDATLREIAVARPAALADLGQISGIGASKLEKFGEGVLAVVAGEGPAG